MPNIFEYLDFRKYLRDFYRTKKELNAGFSYRVFSDKAGFKSKSFLNEIISGQKNLTPESLKKINRVLKLEGSACKYLEDLVGFDGAKNHDQKNMFFKKLLSYKKSSPHKKVLKNQFEFYSKWYHNTIRELITCFEFKNDFALLGKMVRPSITSSQAKKSVNLLLELGLIEKTKSGYVQTSPAITTGDEVVSTAVYNFHVQNMDLMTRALDNSPASKRDISCLIMALSETGFEKMKKRIQVFRKELMQMALEDYGKDQVFHVNLQIAPTSEKVE